MGGVNRDASRQTRGEVLDQYTYTLPPAAIAQRPAQPRDASRLLVLSRTADRDKCEHAHFFDLPGFLAAGDLLVLNDTRVLLARLFGRKIPGGGKAEVLIVRQRDAEYAEVLVRASGRMRPGRVFELDAGYRLELIEPGEPPAYVARIVGPGRLADLLELAGHVPLPPYIRRPDDAADRERYQTVYAREPGAVAAPTAGLHFTERLLGRIAAAGVQTAHVTLHVGPGTFRPLKAEDLARGELHAEVYALPEETVGAIDGARARGARIIAVGTTTTRVLEACATPDGTLRAGGGVTRLFIRPPYSPRVVDGLITNFHLPRTSLLMLIAAFAGRERVLGASREALDAGYRFYSYGDAMLVL